MVRNSVVLFGFSLVALLVSLTVPATAQEVTYSTPVTGPQIYPFSPPPLQNVKGPDLSAVHAPQPVGPIQTLPLPNFQMYTPGTYTGATSVHPNNGNVQNLGAYSITYGNGYNQYGFGNANYRRRNDYPPVIVYVLPGYYFPGYTTVTYSSYSYPSVYGDYSGFPGYFTWPDSSIVTDYQAGPTLFSDGQFYAYDGGADMTAPVAEGPSPITITGPGSVQFYAKTKDHAYAVPSQLQQSLSDIKHAWTTQDMSSITKHIPEDGNVSIGLKGRYAYSIAAPAYQLMTHDAISHISTTNFSYIGMRVNPQGTATAYAVQQYKPQTGGPSSNMYLAYSLRPDAVSGYKIVGVETSASPMIATTPSR